MFLAFASSTLVQKYLKIPETLQKVSKIFLPLRSELRAVSDKLFRHSPRLIVTTLVQSSLLVSLLKELGCEELHFRQTFPSPAPFPHVPEMPITVLPRKYGYRSSP